MERQFNGQTRAGQNLPSYDGFSTELWRLGSEDSQEESDADATSCLNAALW